ncbi:MAG: hypothetical protein OEY10_07200 [Nitrosopumilus sp.]|nr:hypothetical protein [Nitrosopumilus sp.]
MDKPLCKETIYEGMWSKGRPCGKRASTEAGYCKTHDPDIRQAKQEKRDAGWREEWRQATISRKVEEYKAGAWKVLELIALDGDDPVLIAKNYINGIDAIKKGDSK